MMEDSGHQQLYTYNTQKRKKKQHLEIDISVLD
jgi:hypothetical protein